MHVTHLDDHASPPTAFSAPPFRHKEWRNLGLAAGGLAANPSNGIIQQAPSASVQFRRFQGPTLLMRMDSWWREKPVS